MSSEPLKHCADLDISGPSMELLSKVCPDPCGGVYIFSNCMIEYLPKLYHFNSTIVTELPFASVGSGNKEEQKDRLVS
jgi:hypothetical protein